MDLLMQAWQAVQHDPARFFHALAGHMGLSVAALLLAGLLGLPAGIGCARQQGLSQRLEGLVQALRVVPALALLGLLLPLIGTGGLPSLVALVALGCPSILVNTAVGFRQAPSDVLEAARGMGMDRRDRLFRIEWPMALPQILDGFRLAAVDIISGATLAAFIGGGGLGSFIVNGLAMADYGLMLAGALPVTLLALAADGFFAALAASLPTSKAWRAC